jgi:hypothetical protein
MTIRKTAVIAIMLALGLSLILAACSDDKSTSATTESLTLSTAAFDELIAAIAPPSFTGTPTLVSPAIAAAADTGYGFWAQGGQPMLARMFGASGPMALYRNTHRLRWAAEWMNQVRRLGDTTFTGVQTADGEFSGTMTVTRPQSAVNMPAECRAILGDTALRLQYQIQVRLNEQTQTRLQAGIRHDDTCDVMLAYHGFPSPDSTHPNAYEYTLTYAYHNSVSDSVQVRSVHFRAYNDPDGQCAMWAYQINSLNGGQFFYRLSWYDDAFADTCGLGRMIGSGNRQTQFALRYQQMIPADRAEPDPLDPYGHIQHTFGPNYADEGSMLSTGLNEATDPAHMYRLEQLPVSLRDAPVLAESALNPWYQD